MSDFRHLVTNNKLSPIPGRRLARCMGCGARLPVGAAVRGFDGRRCTACLEALADALRAESREADYDRYHLWGRC